MILTYPRSVISLMWLTMTTHQAMGAFLPAGKCENKQFDTTGITIKDLISTFKQTWITDAPELNHVAHGSVQYYFNQTTQEYNSLNEAVLTDGTRVAFTCVLRYLEAEDYFTEECLNDDGSTVLYRDVSLYFVEGKGGLYLRCVDSGGETIATNVVLIGETGNPPMSDEEIKEMLTINMEVFGVPLRPLT